MMKAIRHLWFLAVMFVLAPPGVLFAARPHSGVVIEDGFELSDVALFVAAAIGIWFARRSMRARFRKRRKD